MKITAKELIEELQKVPEDTEVYFQMNDGCCGDYIEMELDSAEADTHIISKTSQFSIIQIRLKALPGYTSCIKSSKTKEFIKGLK